MPEYLAPGVFVEETSFRAKSIEGVGTSTTAFVGRTRKGPVGETPEMITSAGDFERIYGGFGDIGGKPNYLAHGVRAYFDNGGSRLYVSRVYQDGAGPDAGRARSADLIEGAGEARFVGRFAGEAGNGEITIRQMATPATFKSMESAPVGTLLRVGGKPAGPARIPGPRRATFAIKNKGRLLLTVGGADKEITFRGEPTEVTATDVLPAEPPLDEQTNTLRVTLEDGIEQLIVVPIPPAGTKLTRDTVVQEINRQLVGGYARVTAAGDAAGADKLVIGSDRRGKAAAVKVKTNEAFGFKDPQPVEAVGSATAANNVDDLRQVTLNEINTLLRTAAPQPIPVVGVFIPSEGFVLQSTETGETATLKLRNDIDSVEGALELPAGPVFKGAKGDVVEYYVKTPTGWKDKDGNQLLTAGKPLAEAPRGTADFLTMLVAAQDRDGNRLIYEDLGFDSSHPRWVGNVLAPEPSRRSDALENTFALKVDQNFDGLTLRQKLFEGVTDERTIFLEGGSDGQEPDAEAFRKALEQLEKLEDIAIVAAPGYSALAASSAIQAELIKHVEKRRAYRVAVLDAPPGQTPMQARAVRSQLDSKYASLYYPWVVVADPVGRPGTGSGPREITVPPSGFVCGIYARTDVERGVHKAPANEVVRGALRFETDVNFAQQEMLNPLGVNCLRFFPGRGYRVWGARTVSSDPEWKYVNVRRYFIYLENSIDRGTQWAVFEPNGERLWANIRETVASFLYNEWVSGALLGGTPKEAFFVRCDRSTMTQNDLDNGRLICLIGVAPIRPAEFVVFRIGQKTADARA